MKANIYTSPRCPFSDAVCFFVDKSVTIKDYHRVSTATNDVYVCPFFEVTNDEVEDFQGKCKIATFIENQLELHHG